MERRLLRRLCWGAGGGGMGGGSGDGGLGEQLLRTEIFNCAPQIHPAYF